MAAERRSETLLSYGLKPTVNPPRHEQVRLADESADALPKLHLDFLDLLDLSFSCGDYLFVHAGIRPGVPIREQTEDDLLWIRQEFLAHEQPFERFVVHGHTPVSVPDLRSNRINIDTGAFATGRLTCIVIEGCGIAATAHLDGKTSENWIRRSDNGPTGHSKHQRGQRSLNARPVTRAHALAPSVPDPDHAAVSQPAPTSVKTKVAVIIHIPSASLRRWHWILKSIGDVNCFVRHDDRLVE